MKQILGFNITGIRVYAEFSLIIGAAVFTSCSAMPHHYKVAADTDKLGFPKLIHVSKAFTSGSFDIPSGNFAIVGQDDAGVFYQSPKKIVIHPVIGGTEIHDGGFYFRGPKEAHVYYDSNGQICIVSIVVPSTDYVLKNAMNDQ